MIKNTIEVNDFYERINNRVKKKIQFQLEQKLHLQKDEIKRLHSTLLKILDKLENVKKNNDIYITQLNEKKHSLQLNFYTFNQENHKKIQFQRDLFEKNKEEMKLNHNKNIKTLLSQYPTQNNDSLSQILKNHNHNQSIQHILFNTSQEDSLYIQKSLNNNYNNNNNNNNNNNSFNYNNQNSNFSDNSNNQNNNFSDNYNNQNSNFSDNSNNQNSNFSDNYNNQNNNLNDNYIHDSPDKNTNQSNKLDPEIEKKIMFYNNNAQQYQEKMKQLKIKISKFKQLKNKVETKINKQKKSFISKTYQNTINQSTISRYNKQTNALESKMKEKIDFQISKNKRSLMILKRNIRHQKKKIKVIKSNIEESKAKFENQQKEIQDLYEKSNSEYEHLTESLKLYQKNIKKHNYQYQQILIQINEYQQKLEEYDPIIAQLREENLVLSRKIGDLQYHHQGNETHSSSSNSQLVLSFN